MLYYTTEIEDCFWQDELCIQVYANEACYHYESPKIIKNVSKRTVLKSISEISNITPDIIYFIENINNINELAVLNNEFKAVFSTKKNHIVLSISKEFLTLFNC